MNEHIITEQAVETDYDFLLPNESGELIDGEYNETSYTQDENNDPIALINPELIFSDSTETGELTDNERSIFSEIEHNEEEEAYSDDEANFPDTEALLPLLPSLLSLDENKKATAFNQGQLKKLGLSLTDLMSALNKFVDFSAIRALILGYNKNNPGKTYPIDVSGSSVIDAVFTEVIHQFQLANFIDPKEHDGLLGVSTIETIGFFNHGLKQKLNSSGFYGQTILNSSDVKPQVAKVTNDEFTAANWFSHIVRPSWLGVKITDGVHVLLMRKLLDTQSWLLQQPQYQGMTSAALGKALGFTASTRYSAGRFSSGKQGMHGLGLAIDIDVPGNPWIGAGWIQNDEILLQERYRMINAFRKGSGDPSLPGKTVFAYLDSIARSSGYDTAAVHKILKLRNDEFIAFLKKNNSELTYWKNSATFGNRNPLNGFLNLHADLVYALRHVVGLAWGAVDFGPNASGDIMHFDLRTIGIGKILSKKMGGYIPETGHPTIRKEIPNSESEVDFEFNDFSTESDHHEAIEEAVWEEPGITPSTYEFDEGETGSYEQEGSEYTEHEEPVDNLVEDLVPTIPASTIRTRLDEYFTNSAAVYKLPDGTIVKARPQFRISNGQGLLSEDAKVKVKKSLTAKQGAKFTAANSSLIHLSAYGRAKPAEIAIITQALIDAGEFDKIKQRFSPARLSNEQLIRKMQKEFGIGMDCGGYVQLAFTYVFTGKDNHTKDERKKLGLKENRGDENLAGLSSAHFSKVNIRDAQTGDLMVMRPRKGDRDMHAVIVVNHTTMGSLHMYEVDSSWGYLYGDDAAGVARRFLIHETNSHLWWDINPVSKLPDFVNSTGPYNEHPIQGVYRPKPEVTAPKKNEFDGEMEDDEYGYEQSTAEQHEHNFYESEIRNLQDAIRMNRNYGAKIGWQQYYDQINKLLLPYSGQSDLSLTEENLAHAVVEWQRQQGFSESDADGIIGPATWNAMKPFVSTGVVEEPVPAVIPNSGVPPVQNILDFNRWHAQKILDCMKEGIIGQYFSSREQLEKIARGERVLRVDPTSKIIQVLPVIYHIAEQAKLENHREIIIGSFIRDATNGKCTGHCAGQCIDINYKGGSFEKEGSTQMVIKILNYLTTIPTQYKAAIGFGMPLQGSFFGHKNINKYKSVDVSNLVNPELRQLILRLGYVFPDNNNHLHIQVKWLK